MVQKVLEHRAKTSDRDEAAACAAPALLRVAPYTPGPSLCLRRHWETRGHCVITDLQARRAVLAHFAKHLDPTIASGPSKRDEVAKAIERNTAASAKPDQRTHSQGMRAMMLDVMKRCL